MKFRPFLGDKLGFLVACTYRSRFEIEMDLRPIARTTFSNIEEQSPHSAADRMLRSQKQSAYCYANTTWEQSLK